MRTPEEMYALIRKIALEDDRIRAVVLNGSRADKSCPADRYQDFDIVFHVTDVAPYWDNMEWVKNTFGMPSLVQKPESMKLIPPDNTGCYVYLMIFPDGNRIDLTLTPEKANGSCMREGEPAVVLLDKDGMLPGVHTREDYWYIRRPDQQEFSDCCNEFHWCLNNVAKGIARDELCYCMDMFNHYVRDMLICMLEWYIGSEHDFAISAGKRGKYFRKLLPAEIYARFEDTYSDADYGHLWAAVFGELRLFGDVARAVAERLGYRYDEAGEAGITDYLNMVRGAKETL